MEIPSADSIGGSSSNKIFIKPWREIALVAMILMELSWVTLWYRVFARSEQAVPYLQAVVVLTGMLILVYLLNRLMVFLDVRLWVHRLVLLLALLINLFVGLRLLLYARETVSLADIINRPLRSFGDITGVIPAEFVVMMFVLLVCWRGISYSDYQIGSVNAHYGFRLGIVMFFLYAFTLPFINESPHQALYIFLFFSLLSMTTARISVLSQLRGGQNIQFNRQWMLGITLVILVMVGISALVEYFTREQFFGLMSLLFSWIVYLVVLLLSPLLFLALQLFIKLFEAIQIGEIFQFIIQAIRNLEQMMNSFITVVGDWLDRFNFDSVAAFFEQLARLRPLYLWGAVIIVILAILLGLRRFALKEDRSQEEETQLESIDEDLLSLLRSTVRRGLDKLAENLDEILRFRRARQLLAAARIRRVYAMLLGLNARLDNPRPASRTPLEYLPQMERLFPTYSGELTTITDAYLLVRYGELPESVEELERVETAWKRVSSAGKEQLRANRRAKRG